MAEREDWRPRCQRCGQILKAKQRAFCSKRCKNADYNPIIARERAEARTRLICGYCGGPILGTKRRQKYCSLRCQWKAAYWRTPDKHREHGDSLDKLLSP